MADILRTQGNSDGTRSIQKYIGRDPTLTQPGTDRAENWQTVFELKEHEAYSGFVRLHTDCAAAPHPEGTGIIVEIGGVHHGLPLDIARKLLDALTEAIAGAEKAAVAVKAAEAVDAAEVP